MTYSSFLPLANHLWQSTFFAGAAGLLTLALRKNRAAVRFSIWLAASIKFLIPFSVLANLGSQLQWRTAPALAQPQFSAVMNEISQPFEIGGEPNLSPVVVPANPGHFPEFLLAVWLCGVVFGLILWLRLLRQTSALRHDATALSLPLLIPVMQAAKSTRIEPSVVGLFKPVLILPFGITETLTPAQLDTVIAHELHHVRRKDNLCAALHMVVEILFWFHPLVWWIRHRLMEERERACDEAVAAEVRDPQVYAEAILSICKLCVGSPLPCVSGVTGADLKKRIEAIMKNRIALRLNFTRKAVLALAGVGALAAPLVTGIVNAPAARAQSKDSHTQQATRAKVAFEVASIKSAVTPARGPVICLVPCSPGERLTVKGDRVDIRYMPVLDLLIRAYRVKPYQVVGPDWIRSKRFDITAKIPAEVSADRVPEMLQTLLADRFQLTIHRETKDLPVYGLIVGKNGIKLEPSAPDTSVQPPASKNARQMFTPEGDAHFDKTGITISSGQFGPAHSRPGGMWEMSRLTMPGLAELLAGGEDRPVIDETHLSGAYRFAYEIAVEEGSEGQGAAARVQASLTEAIEKGGLKLVRHNAPVEMIVIDHVGNTPTEN